MGTLLQDLRYGARQLRRAPAFAAAAIAALALSIGATTTVFSAANLLVFRGLPAQDPSTLVRIYTGRGSVTTYPDFTAYRDESRSFSGMTAFQVQPVSVRSGGEAESVWAEIVTGEYFSVLGARAQLGRTFLPEEGRQAGSAPVVVLSHRYWTTHFGSDPSIVGRSVAINAVPFTVVGVMPASFSGAMEPVVASIWVPITMDPVLRPGTTRLTDRRFGSVHILGRLNPGVTAARAQADLEVIAARLTQAYPDPARPRTVSVYPARMLPPYARTPVSAFMAFLLAVCGLVLLIACSNVASLLLARSSARRREIAVRQALGAGRRRLLRQLLTEGLLLSFAGGLLGLGLAFLAARALLLLPIEAPMPVVLNLMPNPGVLLFTLGVSCATTVLFALAPALQAVRADALPSLRGGEGVDGYRSPRLRALFITGQLALSLMLLLIAGLCVQSLRHATSTAIGFDRTNVVAVSLDMGARAYAPARAREIQRALLDRLTSAPGIEAAGFTDLVPLTLSSNTDLFVREGEEDAAGRREGIDMGVVSPGYLETLRIPLRAGRDFSANDREGAPLVAVVNETLARSFFGDARAVGRRVLRGRDRVPYEIIGVAADSTYVSVGESPRPFVYVATAQQPVGNPTILVRTRAGATPAMPQVREAVAAVDPDLPVLQARTMAEATAAAMLPARAAGLLLASAGCLALVLAAIGVYGTVAYLVRQRTREIGIRISLGAQPPDVLRLIMRQTLNWTAAGIALGLLGGAAACRVVASLIHGVSPTDPVTFVAMPFVLSAIVAAATFGPARRATRIDPVRTLRQ